MFELPVRQPTPDRPSRQRSSSVPDFPGERTRRGIRATELGADLAALEAAREAASKHRPPAITPACVVHLFGETDSTDHAGILATEYLQSPVYLVDATPIATASAVGTRYTFRTREETQ